MIALELWHLKRICDKNGIDYQEIDSTLTYAENLAHLRTLFEVKVEERMKEWRSREEEYLKEHFLSYYVICSMNGETMSKDMGAPVEPRFSLTAYIQSSK